MDMQNRAQVGWKVVDPDGKDIGTIDDVREDHLVVEQGRLIQHTLYIPFDSLGQAADGQVTVNVAAGDIDAEGWRFPPNAGYAHADPAYPEVPETTTIQNAGMSAGTLSAPEVQGAVLDANIETGEIPNTELERELESPADEDVQDH
jgi:hypothetical protein